MIERQPETKLDNAIGFLGMFLALWALVNLLSHGGPFLGGIILMVGCAISAFIMRSGRTTEAKIGFTLTMALELLYAHIV